MAAPSGSIAKPVYRATVTRDSAGIPHITARDFGSLGYGEGYAFAQDNLCVFADDVVTLRGERTRYFGAGGVAVGYANGARDPNPKSDLYWTAVRSSGRIAQLVRGVRPEVRELYAGRGGLVNAWYGSRSVVVIRAAREGRGSSRSRSGSICAAIRAKRLRPRAYIQSRFGGRLQRRRRGWRDPSPRREEAPFRHYSPILGPYQTAQLFRTRQGNLMVEARLAGTDGLGPRGFDIRSMERMLGRFDNYGGKS